jgi:hypothetical protein
MSRFLLGRIRKFDRSSGGPLLECGVWDRHRRDSELAAYRRRGEDAAGRPRSPGSRQRRLAFRRRTFVRSSAGRLSDLERTWPLAGGLLRRPGLAFFGEAARLHRGPTAAQSRHDDYVSPVVRGCDAPTQPSERASASSTTMKHGYYSEIYHVRQSQGWLSQAIGLRTSMRPKSRVIKGQCGRVTPFG